MNQPSPSAVAGESRQSVTAPGAPAAIGPYSHAVSAAGLLFCSGQIPLDPATGELVGEDVTEQAERCLLNLQAVCAAAGTSLANAVRITVYMTNLARFGEVNAVCAAFFAIDPPARVTVEVSGLPRDALVEIDAIVALAASEGSAASMVLAANEGPAVNEGPAASDR
jgi:2-iminobutanoate/2-iminopropanoate deaminase